MGGTVAAASRAGADLIFSPTHHILPWGSIPVVTTIHDITPITSPSFGVVTNTLDKARLWNAAKLSSRCITDSECSKKDIVEWCGIPSEKVDVIYLGYDRDVFNLCPVSQARQRALRERLGIRGPYVLHHGVVQPRKNLERLIRACRLIWNAHRDMDFQLVLAGPLGWKYEAILDAGHRLGKEGKVIFSKSIHDDDLALLLKGASLCVFPSLYEGFCLPMIEAMACGVPTIASNGSCLPEVSGGKLRYFDPLSIDDMAAAIFGVLQSPDLQRELSERGLRRAAEFSWSRCAQETLALLSRAYAEWGRSGAGYPYLNPIARPTRKADTEF
jgi:glycosyltransferase involved in cell wall biosynthesis